MSADDSSVAPWGRLPAAAWLPLPLIIVAMIVCDRATVGLYLCRAEWVLWPLLATWALWRWPWPRWTHERVAAMACVALGMLGWLIAWVMAA